MKLSGRTPVQINLEELMSTGLTFEITEPERVSGYEDDNDENLDDNTELATAFSDENTYDGVDSFSVLELKMENLYGEDVKKRILRVGYGHNKPEEKSIIRVHYQAFLEYCVIAFDSTYARNKPHTFSLSSGEVIPGLDIAVQSMILNEKSQFLVRPNLAYGKLGCLGRIPPNATILFEVEVLEIVECGAAELFENLPEELKHDFPEVYKYAMALCVKAKDLFHRNLQSAIREYNIAATALEKVALNDLTYQKKQMQLLYKIYSNLLVCYTKLKEPKKGCINFNRLNELVTNTDMKISAKIFYNNAKCLRMLGDYDLAKSRLHKAYKLEPKNQEILNEFKILDEEKMKYSEKEKGLATAFVMNISDKSSNK